MNQNILEIIKLFKDLRDGDMNPKEVLNHQARFKLDLTEIKTGVINTSKGYNKKYYYLW